MVTIQHTQLQEGILRGIAKAKAESEPILVSEVIKIEEIDPYLFFANGRDQFLGERMFWKDPLDRLFLAGLGVCKIITSSAEDRFQDAENRWKRFIQKAIILDQQQINGTGPIMFGGFSFDPLKERTALWTKFDDTLFHIPKYLVTIENGHAFLTTNVLCTKHDDDNLYKTVEAERINILQQAQQQWRRTQAQQKSVHEVEPEGWKKSVANIVEELKEGKLKKVVLARELRISFDESILVENVLARLLKEQKESFVFAFESRGDCFIGASPERLVKKDGEELFSACLAGSIKRGKTESDDYRLGEALLHDPKNLVEHNYVVQMIKEAMEEVCDDVFLDQSPSLMKMRDIQHLYTPVVGKSKADVPLLKLVGRLHPTPALGGWPKEKAVEKIREVEKLERGFYAAPIGWIDSYQNGEFAVAIRSALIQGNEISLFAGCGVVEDSEPHSEFVETKIKFRPMLSAIGGELV